MAKRFTDTEKWRDEWWGSLTNDYRMIWLYLVDSCSIAGLWKKDFRGLNFNCNTNVDEQTFLKVFGDRLIDRGNFYFIPKFLRFQCPKGLNSNKPAIVSIVKELENNNLTQTVIELLGNDFLIIKGKDKGKGIGEGKERIKEVDADFKTVVYDLQSNPLGLYILVTDSTRIKIRIHQQSFEKYMEGTFAGAWEGQKISIKKEPPIEQFFKLKNGETFNNTQHVWQSFKKLWLNPPSTTNVTAKGAGK